MALERKLVVATTHGEPGQLLGAIFSASPDAVVVVDDAGNIVLSSPAVTSLFGFYPEELVGEPIETLMPADRRQLHANHLRRFFDAPRSRLMGAGLELSGRHRDGSQFAVEVSLAPVEIRGRRYAAAFVRDGRERQRAIARLHAVNDITRSLLGGTATREILPFVAQRSRQLASADAVWIVVPSSSGCLEIITADGAGTEALVGVKLSDETSRSAQVMRTGASEIIDDMSVATNVPGPVVALGLGPGLYVPLVAEQRHLGVLVFARVQGAPQFEPLDVAFGEVFGTATTAAIELGEVRAELERIGIVSEDERIARDLHDTVIQQLFAVGMSLQAARASSSGPLSERIDEAVTDLDRIIGDIRNTIFRLPGRTADARGLRDEMLRIADKYRDELGFLPRVAFVGPVDTFVPDVVRSDLVQVLTEALSNTARHAKAGSSEAIVEVRDGWLSFSLIDDGIGFSDGPSAGQGIRNMTVRAENLGGTCSISRRDPSGTLVTWRVPI